MGSKSLPRNIRFWFYQDYLREARDMAEILIDRAQKDSENLKGELAEIQFLSVTPGNVI